MEKRQRLHALLTVFAEQDVEVEESEQQWCLRRWLLLRPYLEGQPSGHYKTYGCYPDQVDEDGSYKQMVKMDNGEVRPLTQAEEDEIAFNELLEEEAAEMERQREAS